MAGPKKEKRKWIFTNDSCWKSASFVFFMPLYRIDHHITNAWREKEYSAMCGFPHKKGNAQLSTREKEFAPRFPLYRSFCSGTFKNYFRRYHYYYYGTFISAPSLSALEPLTSSLNVLCPVHKIAGWKRPARVSSNRNLKHELQPHPFTFSQNASPCLAHNVLLVL